MRIRRFNENRIDRYKKLYKSVDEKDMEEIHQILDIARSEWLKVKIMHKFIRIDNDINMDNDKFALLCKKIEERIKPFTIFQDGYIVYGMEEGHQMSFWINDYPHNLTDEKDYKYNYALFVSEYAKLS